MQVCTLLQTDNHTSTSPLSFYRPDALTAAQPTASKHWRPHRHRIDKYLDRRRPVATAAGHVSADHFQKSKSQDGGLPELLLAYSCLTNHSEAASLWLVTTKQVIWDHQWHVVCCNVECLNFIIKTCAKCLFSSGHLKIITTLVASGLFTSSAPVVKTEMWAIATSPCWMQSEVGNIESVCYHFGLSAC